MKVRVAQTVSQDWLPTLSRVASGFIVAVGAAVLLGWVLGIRWLIVLLPVTVAMSPATAGAFILLGLSLWRLGGGQAAPPKQRDVAGLVLAGIVAVAGGWKVLDYLFGFHFHIDQLLSSNPLAGEPYPLGEMAPNTALNFFLCGLALLLLDVETDRGFRPAQLLALTAGLIALLALIGYAYQVLLLYRVGRALPMSLDSAIAFTVFALGFLAARPGHGWMTVVTSATTGGAMARRLLPMAILIPWLLGALLLVGEQAGYYEREFVVSIFAVASIVIFTSLIWWNARLLYLADLERVRTERRLAVQHEATRVLAESSNLAEAMPKILQTVCQTLGWAVGEMWTLHNPEGRLRCAEIWHEPSAELEAFVEASRKAALERGQGLPGRVWATGQPAWVADVQREANFPRAPLAVEAGLHGGFGFPVRLGPELFGVIEFFSRELEPPDEMLLDMLTGVGSQVGQFIERTRAEEQLRRTSANLQRSNTDLQQFAYVASHDLFEPLRMVTSYLQLLTDRYQARLDKQAQEFIGFAVDGAQRMQALIKDLLEYSRVDIRGRTFQPTDTERVFQAALSNLKVALEESGATVTHDPLPTVMADSVQITQVLQNLIGNGVKFHGAEPPRIHVGARPRNGEWVFQVRDNGIGIEAKDFERIFVIFQRLHTRHEYSGTGMGLAICKKIIERHGGRIWVESTPGQGATFFFTLPAMREG